MPVDHRPSSEPRRCRCDADCALSAKRSASADRSRQCGNWYSSDRLPPRHYNDVERILRWQNRFHRVARSLRPSHRGKERCTGSNEGNRAFQPIDTRLSLFQKFSIGRTNCVLTPSCTIFIIVIHISYNYAILHCLEDIAFKRVARE